MPRVTPRQRHREHPRQRGFTLTELTVVLAIIIVLGSLAVGKLGKSNAETASAGLAHQIMSLCQQAHYTALSSGKQVLVRFQSQNPVTQLRTATVVGNQTLDATQFGAVEYSVEAPTQVQILDVVAGAQITAPVPGLMGDAAISLIFYPNGTVQIPGGDSSGATIYIADVNLQYPQRVLLYGRTGFAKVLAQ